MCKKQTTSRDGYLPENKVEPEEKVRAQSISTMSEDKENDGNENAIKLLEEILARTNMNEAYKRVVSNKGSHGVDGMKVEDLREYLKEHGERIKKSIMEGSYNPIPVRQVEIPKPDGGTRLLGVPTVVDRVIQQSIAQKLNPIYEKEFSEYSYGFRPNRNAHQAVKKSKEYIESGYTWSVDIDLAKYFDTVNHDKLMRILSEKIKDCRVLSLIRKYLQSGVMIGGMFSGTDKGVPQGGNLSPLLGNIMLNELDKELAQRGLRFCRYADDTNIYVKSRKAAERVMESITKFIEGELRLKVNKEKSKVDRPWKLKFLGFSFYFKKCGIGIRVHPKPVKKLKAKLKEITGRSNAKSMNQRIVELRQVITGWVNYFKIADMAGLARETDEWLRRRVRMCYWKRWKRIKTRHDNLVRLGIENTKAWEFGNTRKSYWRISNSPILTRTFTNEYLKKLGFPTITERYSKVH